MLGIDAEPAPGPREPAQSCPCPGPSLESAKPALVQACDCADHRAPTQAFRSCPERETRAARREHKGDVAAGPMDRARRNGWFSISVRTALDAQWRPRCMPPQDVRSGDNSACRPHRLRRSAPGRFRTTTPPSPIAATPAASIACERATAPAPCGHTLRRFAPDHLSC